MREYLTAYVRAQPIVSKTPRGTKRLKSAQLRCLVMAWLIGVPHFLGLGLYLSVLLALVTLSLGYFCWYRSCVVPSALKFLLIVVGAGSVLVSAASFAGPQGMIILLLSGFFLKLLELLSARDRLFFIYLGFLVTATQLLLNQSLMAVVYSLLCVFVLLLALFQFSRDVAIESALAGQLNLGGEPETLRQPGLFQALEGGRLAGFLVLQAVPIAAVLFLVFPRIAPLWQMNIQKPAASTGLSDAMSPGDISRLTRNAESAFRVSFEGDAPNQQALYWKALTYTEFDGRRWDVGDKWSLRPVIYGNVGQGQGTQVHKYELLPQSLSRYLPRLDVALSSNGAQVLADNTLGKQAQALEPIYRFEAVLGAKEGYSAGPVVPAQLAVYLSHLTRLPDANPRFVQWVKQNTTLNPTVTEVVTLLSKVFAQDFRYSLSPERLGQHPLDDFFFESQTGFCGHFASAAAVAFRAAGIPSRVVGGYQGGELNPYESFFQIRQYDAHAWVEAWDKDRQHWIRFDPTAIVMPERLDRPSEVTFSDTPDFLADQQLLKFGMSSPLFSALRLRWDAFNYGWQRWVVNYDKRQLELLSNWLGDLTAGKLAMVILIPMLLTCGAVFLLLLFPLKRKKLAVPEVERIRVEKILAEALNLRREKGETLQQFTRRLSEEHSELSPSLRGFNACYQRLCYAPSLTDRSQEADVEKLKESVKMLRKQLKKLGFV